MNEEISNGTQKRRQISKNSLHPLYLNYSNIGGVNMKNLKVIDETASVIVNISWEFNDGSEGGTVLVVDDYVIDYDGATELPDYIIEELNELGYILED